eukprot:NODE_35_length_3329_cov_16.644597_g33_i0.p1 GENE.NODE_35_length_3329_cov_16.644597_g33_i0~~NODE_35_length_3329_cov_16.644597_g33_i0.p1  ORF type:complete len:1088 (-),score=221.03 NODE_35_length_3329_cov_16.644597_g33_i0:22-3285(-)
MLRYYLGIPRLPPWREKAHLGTLPPDELPTSFLLGLTKHPTYQQYALTDEQMDVVGRRFATVADLEAAIQLGETLVELIALGLDVHTAECVRGMVQHALGIVKAMTMEDVDGRGPLVKYKLLECPCTWKKLPLDIPCMKFWFENGRTTHPRCVVRFFKEYVHLHAVEIDHPPREVVEALAAQHALKRMDYHYFCKPVAAPELVTLPSTLTALELHGIDKPTWLQVASWMHGTALEYLAVNSDVIDDTVLDALVLGAPITLKKLQCVCDNSVTAIPDTLARLTNLTDLMLECCSRFEYITPHITALPLTQLWVSSSTSLTFVPQLPPTLRLCDVRGTGITVLPIPYDNKLEWVNVSHTTVRRLPEHVPTLRVLRIEDCRQLRQLPELPHLEELHAAHSGLTCLPSLPRLLKVDIANTAVTELPPRPLHFTTVTAAIVGANVHVHTPEKWGQVACIDGNKLHQEARWGTLGNQFLWLRENSADVLALVPLLVQRDSKGKTPLDLDKDSVETERLPVPDWVHKMVRDYQQQLADDLPVEAREVKWDDDARTIAAAASTASTRGSCNVPMEILGFVTRVHTCFDPSHVFRQRPRPTLLSIHCCNFPNFPVDDGQYLPGRKVAADAVLGMFTTYETHTLVDPTVEEVLDFLTLHGKQRCSNNILMVYIATHGGEDQLYFRDSVQGQPETAIHVADIRTALLAGRSAHYGRVVLVTDACDVLAELPPRRGGAMSVGTIHHGTTGFIHIAAVQNEGEKTLDNPPWSAKWVQSMQECVDAFGIVTGDHIREAAASAGGDAAFTRKAMDGEPIDVPIVYRGAPSVLRVEGPPPFQGVFVILPHMPTSPEPRWCHLKDCKLALHKASDCEWTFENLNDEDGDGILGKCDGQLSYPDEVVQWTRLDKPVDMKVERDEDLIDGVRQLLDWEHRRQEPDATIPPSNASFWELTEVDSEVPQLSPDEPAPASAPHAKPPPDATHAPASAPHAEPPLEKDDDDAPHPELIARGFPDVLVNDRYRLSTWDHTDVTYTHVSYNDIRIAGQYNDQWTIRRGDEVLSVTIMHTVGAWDVHHASWSVDGTETTWMKQATLDVDRQVP